MQCLENGSLSIRQVAKDDEGVYLCEADNSVGEPLMAAAKLVVHLQAQFADELQLVDATAALPASGTQLAARDSDAAGAAPIPVRALKLLPATQVRLLCLPFGELPLFVDWLKDGQLVFSSTNSPLDDSPQQASQRHDESSAQLVARAHVNVRKSERRANGLESELILTNVRRSDAGLYACHARNAFGSAERKLQLLLQEPPSAPETIDVAHISSRSLALRWLAPFDGQSPIFKYLVESRKLEGKSRHLTNVLAAIASRLTRHFPDQGSLQVSEKLVSASEAAAIAGQSVHQPSFGQLAAGSNAQQRFLTHTLHDLEPLTKYAIRIVAVNAVGKSKPSFALNFRTEEEGKLCGCLRTRTAVCCSQLSVCSLLERKFN